MLLQVFKRKIYFVFIWIYIFFLLLLASDWTMYAFSTQNQKDYFNLMSVYLDAVLHPKLDEYDFM